MDALYIFILGFGAALALLLTMYLIANAPRGDDPLREVREREVAKARYERAYMRPEEE